MFDYFRNGVKSWKIGLSNVFIELHNVKSGLGPPVVGHVSADLFGISSVRLVLSFCSTPFRVLFFVIG